MGQVISDRPALLADLPGSEFGRWYWLKKELEDFARSLGLSTAGSKTLLTARIRSHLDGTPFAEPPSRRAGPSAQLTGELSHRTVIPAGHRCTQPIRAWFEEQVGPAFRFDAAMRDFFAAANGTQTLADALAHWHARRDRGPQQIDGQFEYNRFTRAWRRDHPTGGRAELLAAWWNYRNRPIDARGLI